MTDREKEEGDFSETDAVEIDEDGNPRVAMESLQKGGSDEDDWDELVQKSEEE